MEIIDTNTARVDNFEDFSSILNANNDFTYVYLGTNINMTSGIYNDQILKATPLFILMVQFTTNSSARGLYLNNPKSFVLYNRGPGTAIYFSSSTPFVFFGEQVNFWRDAGLFPAAGTFDDLPLYPWHNPDWSSFEIRGSVTTNSTTVDFSTLSPPVDPALTNLKLQEARILSVGDLPLTVNPVVNDQTPVTGETDPYANIKMVYTDESGTHTFTGIADENGSFSVSTSVPIPLGTTVEVSANVLFLYIIVPMTSQEAGELYIDSTPELISFIAPPSRLLLCASLGVVPMFL